LPLVGGTVEALVSLEPEVLESWRLALTGIYGLAAALLLGYLWFLIADKSQGEYGFAALFLGAIVGFVVAVFSGGSGRIAYRVMGALLAALGVLAGQYLIFALPKTDFIFEFSSMTLLIYGLAVYEG
jgi:hypothetical protein